MSASHRPKNALNVETSHRGEVKGDENIVVAVFSRNRGDNPQQRREMMDKAAELVLDDEEGLDKT